MSKVDINMVDREIFNIVEIFHQKVVTLDSEGNDCGESYGIEIAYGNKSEYVFGMDYKELRKMSVTQLLDEIETHCPDYFMKAVFHYNGFYLLEQWIELGSTGTKDYTEEFKVVLKSRGYSNLTVDEKVSQNEIVYTGFEELPFPIEVKLKVIKEPGEVAVYREEEGKMVFDANLSITEYKQLIESIR